MVRDINRRTRGVSVASRGTELQVLNLPAVVHARFRFYGSSARVGSGDFVYVWGRGSGVPKFMLRSMLQRAEAEAKFNYGLRFGKSPSLVVLDYYFFDYKGAGVVKRENWRGVGRVIVARDVRGRIVSRSFY